MGGSCGLCDGLMGLRTAVTQRTVVVHHPFKSMVVEHEEPWNMFEDPNADLLGNSIFGAPGPIPQENIVFERQSHEL